MRLLSRWIFTLCTTPAGLVALAALDSTVFFSLPLALDASLVLLSARSRGFAWGLLLLVVASSMLGAGFTFWMGVKIRETGLEHFVPPTRLDRIRARVKNTGAVPLALLDLIPPPFPFTPFLLVAGALDVQAPAFFATLFICRIVRFGGEVLLARRYGPQILAWLESDTFRDIFGTLFALSIVATIVAIVKLARRSRDQVGYPSPLGRS